MRRASAALFATALVGLLATAASAALATVPPPTPTPTAAPARTVAAAAAAPPKARPNLPSARLMPAVVVVGDGLTESSFSSADGFGALLARQYTRRADVLNRGFGGFLTEWIADPRTMLPSLFPPACENRTILAVVFLGVKESVTESASAAWGRPYVSPEAFEAAVDRIVGGALASGARRVVLVTPPPVCDVLCSKAGTDVSTLARNTANSRRYVEALGRVAGRRDTEKAAASAGAGGQKQPAPTAGGGGGGATKVRLLDIFSAWPRDFPEDWPARYLADDRLHLSPGGHARLLKDLTALLSAEMADVAPTPFSAGQSPADRAGMLPLFWPHMDDVDMLDPAAAFDRAAGPGAGACAAAAGAGERDGRRSLAGEAGGGGGEGQASGAAAGSSRGLQWMTAGVGLGLGAAAARQAA